MENQRAFIIFLTIVLLVYAGLNFYVYRRTMQAASPVGGWLWVMRIVLWIGILSYPLGRTIGLTNGMGAFLFRVGSFWLAVLTYGVMIAVLVDLIRLIDLLTGWLPGWVTADRLQAGRMIFAGSFVLITTLIVGGYVRALYPKTPEYTIELDKLPEEQNEYRIAVLADVHLGAVVGEKRLKRMLELVDYQYPNLVVFCGDLVDEPASHLPWAIEPLSNISAEDGVYAVTGNHEFYDGLEEFKELCDKTGINLLRDQAVTIDSVFNLIGLDDQTGHQQFNLKQTPISDLVKQTNPDLPTILLHHTPTRLKEAAAAGVDLMVSGHVHEGQLWPIKFLAEATYGVKTGLSMIDKMYFYLTPGAGTWGPPVRVLSAPEVATLVLKRKN